MEKTVPPDTLVVRGDPLKQARAARGLSVHEMAGAVTLSREQIRALEDGGNAPFYSAAHKRLALKKYSAALGIPLSELIVDGTEDAVQAPAEVEGLAAAVPGTPSEIRMATAERTARLRRQLLMTAVASALVLALYAKQRGSMDSAAPPAAVETSQADLSSDTAAAAPDPRAPAPAVTDPAPIATVAAPDTAACSLPPAAEVAAWSPPYRRKTDVRLFLISGKPVEVCIADASGKPSLITLKPNAGQVFVGQPPYLVKANGLGSIEIYLQGMRVRAPLDATALRLVPTTLARPPDVVASTSPPAE